MSSAKRQICVWAVVDREGEVVGAYMNRVSAARRCDYLDSRFEESKVKEFAPYTMVRCVGEVVS